MSSTLATKSRTPLNEALPKRYAYDAAAGAIAGFGVAPIVAAVDKALAENASGKEKLWTSFGKSLGEMVRHPINVR